MTVTPRPAGLTTRAAVLGLVVCALVVSAALPLREFLSQRADIRHLQQSQAAARARVAALEEQKARLEDPSYTAALARDRLHFVRPGETAYVVIAPSAPPVAPKDAERAAGRAEGRRARGCRAHRPRGAVVLPAVGQRAQRRPPGAGAQHQVSE